MICWFDDAEFGLFVFNDHIIVYYKTLSFQIGFNGFIANRVGCICCI